MRPRGYYFEITNYINRLILRFLFIDEESKNEQMWNFDDRNLKHELDNILSAILQLIHLVCIIVND